jgi:hypothetical protein
MVKAVSMVLVGLLTSLPHPVVAQQLSASLNQFVGVWETVDTYHPVSGEPTVEHGTRTCQWIMERSYLQCETVTKRTNKAPRVYRFLVNYNRTVARFEMLSLWSNVPHKLVQSLTPDADQRRWRFSNVVVIGDDEPLSEHWSELVFETADRIVWTGRRIGPGVPVADAPISFRENWTRIK